MAHELTSQKEIFLKSNIFYTGIGAALFGASVLSIFCQSFSNSSQKTVVARQGMCYNERIGMRSVMWRM